MGLRRFLAPPESFSGDIIELPPQEAAHARKVLRLKTGQEISLIDGQGKSAKARIVQMTKDKVLCRIEQLKSLSPLSPKLVLCPGLLKAPAMDTLAEKLTELAVDEVRPMVCARSVPRLGQPAARLARWERLAGQALKQCGGPRMPRFFPPASLEHILEHAPQSVPRLLLYEKEKASTLAEVLNQLVDINEVWVLVGPEGGFSDQEAEIARLAGFTLCGLAGPILRAETASMAVASVIRFGR